MIDYLWALFYIFIFPGFLFISFLAMTVQWIDRKVAARLQKRVGPPFIQPLADFIKLLTKEDIVPKEADSGMFSAVPIVGLAAVLSAFIYIPIYMVDSPTGFSIDLLVVLYLLTVPTLALFLAGWHSSNLFGQIGSMRAITQLISYEIPFFVAMLAPALIAGTWSLTGIMQYQADNLWLIISPAILAFFIGIITLQGKLERLPFDSPEAETELVGGPLADYSGRRYALFRFMMDVEMVVGAALIAVLFLGGGDIFIDLGSMQWFIDLGSIQWFVANLIGFIALMVKIIFIVLILTVIKVAVARLRIDQMVKFSYRFMIPLALLQLLIIIIMKVWL
ncbi:MAG: NADH-quinone oxidoreductase subunit H [Thermoplasmata archaeon]|nr:NADH-quinone oxidoreductase subunit H [Thermoplasmata archaeon]